MAVVSELIDLGLALKRQGKLKGAIEHFRQLQATYPENVRIMFELAVCWSEFDVPEQALPLYRDLLARPKGKSLPAKDLPRLYTRLGAALYALQEYDQALSILDEGLRLHPSYRPLRAYRIFALQAAEMPGSALNDALELMLESLAPSRWDTFEDQIRQIVKALRAPHDEVAIAAAPPDIKAEAQAFAQPAEDIQSRPPAHDSPDPPELAAKVEKEQVPGSAEDHKIAVDWSAPIEEDFELDLRVHKQAAKTRVNKKARDRRGQLGKKAVRINISDAKDKNESSSQDDAPSAPSAPSGPSNPSGKFQIPIDSD